MMLLCRVLYAGLVVIVVPNCNWYFLKVNKLLALNSALVDKVEKLTQRVMQLEELKQSHESLLETHSTLVITSLSFDCFHAN